MCPKLTQYRTYKFDAAPFFFYIDVLPLNLSLYDIPHHVDILKNIQFNPIMPLPLRVDRVFSGESSIIIRPSDLVSFPINENIAVIDPQGFIQLGIEKLLYLTEVRASRDFSFSLTPNNAKKWWNSTKFLYGRLRTLEEDFVAFLRAYLHIMVKAKLNNDDLISAAVKYCEFIRDICNKRIDGKQILVEIKDKEKAVNMFKRKEGKVYQKRFKTKKVNLLYPTFVDIEVQNLEESGYSNFERNNYQYLKIKSKDIKYLPLLFYDDLLECMLQNLVRLKEFNGVILDSSLLLEKDVIKLFDNEISDPILYSWFQDFNSIDTDSVMNDLKPTFPFDVR